MRDKIIEFINGWNENKYSAVSRDALRDLLEWPDPDGKSLGLLLVEKIESEYSPQTRPLVSSSKIRNIMVDVVEGGKVYSRIAVALLESNWDFIDKGKLMNKSPEEVKDFLESLVPEVGKYDHMNSSRRALLQMIFDAYMRSHELGGTNGRSRTTDNQRSSTG